MATPSFTLQNNNVLADAESTGGWFGASVGLDNEVFIQGSNSIGGEFRSDLQTQGYANASAPSGSGKTFRGWWNFTFVSFLDIEANGGMEFFMGDGTREFRTVAGRDTYAGGWFYVVASVDKFTTLTAANVDEWGFRFNRTAQPRKLRNMYTDYFFYMDGYFVTGGTAVDPVTLSDIGIVDANSSLGLVTDIDGAFFCTGELQIGNGATATDFDMDGNVLIYTDQEVSAGLYRFVIDGTGVNAELRNSLFQSTGTTDDTRFIFDLSADNFTLTNVGCVLQRAAAISFGSSQTINSWTFTDCFAITTNGATLSECTINDTASTSAVVVSNLSQVDACVFTGDNTSHAVELTTVATNGETQTWNCSATGYTSGSPATVTTTNNDAHILVTASTSNDLTISVSAGATIPSVKLDAAYTGTVTVQSGLATLTISGVIAGSDVVIYTAGSITKLQDDQDISGTTSTYTYTFSAGTFVDIKVYAEGYTPFFIYGFELGSASATLPVAQQLDRNYVP
jgi:hypothetical protein